MSFFDAFDRPAPLAAGTAALPIPIDGTGSPYALKALEDESRKVQFAAVGTRNDALNTAAFNMAQLVAAGHIDQQAVRDALSSAAYGAGLEEKEIVATLNSGLGAGSLLPRNVPDLPPMTPPPVTVVEGNGHAEVLDAEQVFARWVDVEAGRERIRRAARRLLDEEDAVKAFRVPPHRPSLTEELEIPDEPATYSVAEIMPTGANVLLAASYKTGKTTFVNELARSFADGEPFLGRYDVAKLDGRVALFNYEVDDRQNRRWLRDLGIDNTDAIVPLNLRGFRLPVTVPYVEDWVVAWLADREIQIWVVDPFARAFTGCGTSENDNTEVGRFLDTLDVIKNRAGVSDLVLPTHTGRETFEPGAERARGATRLDDWADVRWILTKDDEGDRYFRATGRDVEVEEEKLAFDGATRRLTIGGWDRKTASKRRLEDQVLEMVRSSPGCSQREICDAVDKSHGPVKKALEGLERAHKIQVRKAQKRGQADVYYPAGVTPIE